MSEDENMTDTAVPEENAEATVADSEEKERLQIEVAIDEVGPCKRHVLVRVPREDIERLRGKVIDELVETADVPGFRKGRVPSRLAAKRFRQEISDEIRQKVLIQSLEQISEDESLDPIDEPDLDIESIKIPDEGDFEYEFDVEVRPDFEIPDYRGLQIQRAAHDVSEEEVDAYLERFLSQYGELNTHDGPADKGLYVDVSIEFYHGDRLLRDASHLKVCLKPMLRFRDAEIPGFDELMTGAVAGAERETELTVSTEASAVEMRGETVQACFKVHAVKSMQLPELNRKFLRRIGVESEDELRVEVSEILERQVVYEQRQATRRQVLEKITESADWDLPEALVSKQVENAMHREVLEMQQAGFTTPMIRARENELRQHAIATTRQAMKEHFVLDKIAELEKIDVTPQDIDAEIRLMAMQRGENPRRLRARLEKSGVIENLEAQIRERKVVDLILEHAEYEEVELERSDEMDVEAVELAVCGSVATTGVEAREQQDAEPVGQA